MLIKLKHFLAKFSTLQLCIGFSVLFHVVLMTARFVDPEGFNRVFKDTPLEVVLVNAKSNDLDELKAKAQAIAQFKLNGGGEAEKGLASSPLPSSGLTDLGQNQEVAQRQVEQMQQQQARLLAEIKSQALSIPKPSPKEMSAKDRAEQEEKRRQLMKLIATIEKRINEENARPKKRYISPATRQESYALYYDTLRRKIETRGTQNFPESMGRKLYGELTLLITVNFDGNVVGMPEVVQSSNNKLLDRQAQTIAQQSGPYGTFTTDMRKQADQLVIVSRFKFTREGALEATVGAN